MANINPIKIFQKDNVKEEYYAFSGYVKGTRKRSAGKITLGVGEGYFKCSVSAH